MNQIADNQPGPAPDAAPGPAPDAAIAWRPVRIARIVPETAEISSFHLEPADGGGFAAHQAGQHLPVRALLPGRTVPIARTYTLSCAPADGHRLSVKRQGEFSSFLHGCEPGDMIEALDPAGDFRITGSETRPAVLIGAGIGITPMLAMLRQIVRDGQRTGITRPTWLVHVARNRALRPFHAEISALVAQAPGNVRFASVHSEPDPRERAGEDHSWQGHFSAADLPRLLPFGDYDFYLCGPGGFMQSLYDGLREFNVANDRIHAEAFGPSALQRRPDNAAAAPAAVQSATGAVPVLFSQTGKTILWEPGAGSLLELAEAHGIDAQFGCRAGKCGACAVPLQQGEIAYVNPPVAAVAEGCVLICSAVPHQNSLSLQLAL